MVLEATMVCVDNSEWMRNGDLNPSRFEAQSEAISLLAGQRTQENPENTVGILSLAGKGPRVHVTPTPDLGKILNVMHELSMDGETSICSGVQIAQLALKHRQNKNQRQRIVLFVGSPVTVEQSALVKMGKKLKKNNVAIDIVTFGSVEDENTSKLQALLDAVNSNDNSHLIVVPDGAILADCLISSPVFAGEDGVPMMGMAAAAAGGGGEGFEYGVDPNLDPELALALRVSMEEERARQEANAKKEQEGQGGETAAASAGEASSAAAAPPPDAGVSDMALDDDTLLQQALAMSMSQGAGEMEGVQAVPTPAPPAPMPSTEDDELALAIQMSIADAAAMSGGDAAAPAAESADASMSQVLGDASFMNSVLASLPGVDPNDPSVKEMLESLGAQQGDQGSDEQSDKDKTDEK